jgi:hypothetical protein
MAISKVSSTRSMVIEVDTRHPTSIREKTSITKAT